MSLLDRLPRLRFSRGLRPTPRSSAIQQIANSLATIARGIHIIVLKEYKVDIEAPQPTRADRTREVFEPMYAQPVEEAIREHVETLAALEEDRGQSVSAREVADGALRGLKFPSRGAQSDDDMTPEERKFLAELDGAYDDAAGDASGDDSPIE